jgi:hypothetical protein
MKLLNLLNNLSDLKKSRKFRMGDLLRRSPSQAPEQQLVVPMWDEWEYGLSYNSIGTGVEIY